MHALSHITAETTLNVVPSVDRPVVRRGGAGVIDRGGMTKPASKPVSSWKHYSTCFFTTDTAKPASIQSGGGLRNRVGGRPAE